jgi:hypothetical protein
VSCTITDIADAVVAEMNGHAFAQSFAAVRGYVPIYSLEQMASLHVTVVPKTTTLQPHSRASVQMDVSVDIAVQQRVADDAAADVLMALVEEIADFFRQRRLASVAAVWVSAENNPIYSPEHLAEKRVFTSVLTLTWRRWR